MVLFCGVLCVFTVPGDLPTGDYQGGWEDMLSGEPTLHFGWLHLGRLAGLLDKQLQTVYFKVALVYRSSLRARIRKRKRHAGFIGLSCLESIQQYLQIPGCFVIGNYLTVWHHGSK